MEIIHIAPDQKFINSAYWQFEQVNPGENTFYLLVENRNAQVKHVDVNEDFKFLRRNVDEIAAVAKSFEGRKFFCFHGLDYYSSIFMNNLSAQHKTLWMLWGSEVYGNKKLFSSQEILGPLTRKLLRDSRWDKFLNTAKDTLSYLPLLAKLRKENPDDVACRAMKRADYFGVLSSMELDLVKERTGTKAKFFKFSYFPIERILDNREARIKSDNIFVGNSATKTSNHLEIFEDLMELPVHDRKIIVPLSYGDWDDDYTELVIKSGEQAFGDNFVPLKDFMPLPVYNEFLEQCGIVIMNHYRQQGFGIICAMLWMGARVYLNEKNSIFKYFKMLGLHIYSIQKDLRQDNPQVFSLLSFSEQQKNKEILKAQIGQKTLLRVLRSQIQTLATEETS